jgi:hypothetical protein
MGVVVLFMLELRNSPNEIIFTHSLRWGFMIYFYFYKIVNNIDITILEYFNKIRLNSEGKIGLIEICAQKIKDLGLHC